MRKLTFKGFLSQYVRKLSHSDTLDLKRLADEALTNNPRLRAPLVLYALAHGKQEKLASLLGSSGPAAEMPDMLGRLDPERLEAQLAEGLVPEAYRKVWTSFLVARDAPQRDGELKAAMRKKVLLLQKEKNCSNYRVYTDLKLNPGNINSWLKNGDSTKVSYHTAERVMNYVLQY